MKQVLVSRIVPGLLISAFLWFVSLMVGSNWNLGSLSPDNVKVMAVLVILNVAVLGYMLWSAAKLKEIVWWGICMLGALLVFGKWSLISLPIVAALIAPLLGVSWGLIAVSYLALTFVILPSVGEMAWLVFILQLGLALPVVFWLSRVRQIRTLLEVTIMFLVCDLLFRLLLIWPQPFEWQELVKLGLMHTFAVLIAVFALQEILGNVFEKVSLWRLLELLNPMHPLLKQLREEAPGTYYHSIAVGELTLQAAANLKDADLLLIRVACMYHDIGKLSNPKHFTENQIDAKDRYDKKNLKRSKQMILQHVKDGLSMASKYGLPKAVSDFIPSHHGTGVTAFFYKDPSPKKKVVDYRYPGPKPWTKEQAIMMLADGTEAASKAMSEELNERSDFEVLVDKIVQARVDSGQLDNSPLTFSDLTMVKKSFVDTLYSMYHKRVKYPSMEGISLEEASIC